MPLERGSVPEVLGSGVEHGYGNGSAGVDTNGSPRDAGYLASRIAASGSTVALTGAGISVPSGVPDFRSPGKGIWEKFDPFEVAHIDAFHRDPKTFWEFYRPRFGMLSDKEPNAAHRALAELERRDLLEAVVTQNIDRLHRAAGSEAVLEIHGSIETSSCSGCGRRYPLAEVDSLFGTDGVARCRDCGDPARPDVVLFGEMLPAETLARAEQLAGDCDLIICIGSSLEVHPAAGLVDIALAGGAELAIITKGRTPYDRYASVRLSGDVAGELGSVVEHLGDREGAR